jgi:hypothetical protein
MTDRFDAQRDLPWLQYTEDPEEPNLNTGERWSEWDLRDLEYASAMASPSKRLPTSSAGRRPR